MATGLCALTDSVLPMYTEGLLAAAVRQRIDAHAAACPACRRRLERAAATLAPPPDAAVATVERSRQLSARRRRTMLYGRVVIVLLLIGAVGLRYASVRKQLRERDRLPARVASAEALARR